MRKQCSLSNNYESLMSRTPGLPLARPVGLWALVTKAEGWTTKMFHGDVPTASDIWQKRRDAGLSPSAQLGFACMAGQEYRKWDMWFMHTDQLKQNQCRLCQPNMLFNYWWNEPNKSAFLFIFYLLSWKWSTCRHCCKNGRQHHEKDCWYVFPRSHIRSNHFLSLSQGRLFSNFTVKVHPPVSPERKCNTFQFRLYCLVPSFAFLGTLHTSWWMSEKVFQYAGESALWKGHIKIASRCWVLIGMADSKPTIQSGSRLQEKKGREKREE